MSKHLPKTLYVVAIAAISIGFLPADAKPSSASVDAIYLVSRCVASPCTTSDPALASNAIVQGKIEIHVSAHTGLSGLDRVIIETLPPATADSEENYVCLQQWYASLSLSYTNHYVWNTLRWPYAGRDSGCPETITHSHGELSDNGTYKIRVRAYDSEQGSQTPTDSAGFSLRVANVPATPAWSKPLTVGTDPNGAPSVAIHWVPIPKVIDISEYHFIRVGPDGRTSEFAIDAHSPETQGCLRVDTRSESYYSCRDSDFSSASSGTYRYSIASLRPAAGAVTRCSLTAKPCLESAPSASRSIDVVVPAAEAKPSASLSGTPSAGARASASAAALAQPSEVPTTEAAVGQDKLSNHHSSRTWPVGVAILLLAGGLAGLAFLRGKGKGRFAPKT